MEEQVLLSVEFAIESVKRETIRRCHDAASDRRSPVRELAPRRTKSGQETTANRSKVAKRPAVEASEAETTPKRSTRSKYGAAIEITISPRKMIE